MIVIAILCAAIVAACLTGAVVFLRVGIGREESDHSLLGAPTTRAATLTRRIVGLYVRTPRNDIGPGQTVPRTATCETASKISGAR
jgi:hypothetical protein